MCDNNDDDLPMRIKKINLKDEKCKKCNGENGQAAILLRNDDKPFCKECFLLACTHKFRSEFGKSKVIRQGETVLIGFSGGPSSYAMLELIKQGLSESQFRKLRFNPIFVHIIENESNIIEIEDALKDSGFPYHMKQPSDLSDNRLSLIMSSLRNGSKVATSWQAAKMAVLKDVLVDMAVANGCSRVLLATNCSRMALNVLSKVAQGCGVGCADEVAFEDGRHGISIVQPMRGFSAKEVACLNSFCEVRPPFSANEETMRPKTFSMNRLTEEFLAGLTAGFPSTIFTISRTAEKMTCVEGARPSRACQLCKNWYQEDGEASSAAAALRHSLSLLAPIKETSLRLSSKTEARDGLCHSCLIVEDEVGPLPSSS